MVTHDCGHRDETRQVASLCAYCRTRLAAENLYGVTLQYDIAGVLESEEDLPALDLEITHLHCADCNQLTPIEDLALQLDDRRTCATCTERSRRLAEEKRKLEAEGQERLF